MGARKEPTPPPSVPMSPRVIEKAFNAWMKDYTENTEKFEAEWKTVTCFLKEQRAGKTPSYGAMCAEFLQRYADRL